MNLRKSVRPRINLLNRALRHEQRQPQTSILIKMSKPMAHGRADFSNPAVGHHDLCGTNRQSALPGCDLEPSRGALPCDLTGCDLPDSRVASGF